MVLGGVSLLGLMHAPVLCWLSVLSPSGTSQRVRMSLGCPLLGQLCLPPALPATRHKPLGAFLTLTPACNEVVRMIAAGAVRDLQLKRGRPPDSLTEHLIQLKSME